MRDLFRRVFGRDTPETASHPDQPAPDTGRDEPVYAIGDIHGRSDLLIDLLRQIEADANAVGAYAPLTVFLGDYIDRGDHSAEVIDCLTVIEEEGAAEAVFLRGNHEQMMLDFLEDPATASRWLRFGGLSTLMSYGLRGITGTSSAEDLAVVRDRLAEAVDPAHVAFLKRLSHSHRAGNLLFTHAGADPGIPVEMQNPSTLLWGCATFGAMPRHDGIWVVHGHTIVDTPAARRGVISVDTGAYVTGHLTAARIWQGEVSFLST